MHFFRGCSTPCCGQLNHCLLAPQALNKQRRSKFKKDNQIVSSNELLIMIARPNIPKVSAVFFDGIKSNTVRLSSKQY